MASTRCHTSREGAAAASRRRRSTQVHLIEDTCVAASKEAALEKALSKMEGNWSDAEFGTKEWRTGRILAGIDEIQQELDDQIVLTQCLSLSMTRS